MTGSATPWQHRLAEKHFEFNVRKLASIADVLDNENFDASSLYTIHNHCTLLVDIMRGSKNEIDFRLVVEARVDNMDPLQAARALLRRLHSRPPSFQY